MKWTSFLLLAPRIGARNAVPRALIRAAVALVCLAVPAARAEQDPDLPEMVFKEDFENADQGKRVLRAGALDSARTFAYSRWAVRGATGADRCSEIQIRQDNPPLYTTATAVRLNFAILVTAKTEVQVQAYIGQKGYIRYSFTPGVVDDWCVQCLPVGDFVDDNLVQTASGVAVTILKFRTAAPAEMWLDDVIVTPDPPKVDLTEALLKVRLKTDPFPARVLAQRRGQTLTIRRDFAFLTPEIIGHLRRNVWRKDQVTAKTVLNVGGDVAASRSFWEPLAAAKGPLEGYTLCPKMLCTSSGAPLETLKQRYAKALAEQKPEVVTVIVGAADFAKGKTPKMVTEDLAAAAQLAADAGAVPILYTPPIPNAGPAAEAGRELIAGIRELALSRNWPLLDAWAAINSWSNNAPRPELLSGGGPSTAGYKAINDASLALYLKLEEWVFDRRPRQIPAVPEANLAAAEEPIGGVPLPLPARPDTKADTKADTKKAGPAAKAETKPAEKPVAKAAEPAKPEPKKPVNENDVD
jgi:lysophospholipase L1-like esterase